MTTNPFLPGLVNQTWARADFIGLALTELGASTRQTVNRATPRDLAKPKPSKEASAGKHGGPNAGECWITHRQIQTLLDLDDDKRIEEGEPSDFTVFRSKERCIGHERVQVQANTIPSLRTVVGKTESGEPLMNGSKDFETQRKQETLVTATSK